MSEYVSESGHWYAKDGTPTYEVPYADPKKGMRKTTLRDAKKLDLVPSVTTLLNVFNKPALNRWKEQQILLSALTLPAVKGETVDEFKKRIEEDSQAQAKAARDRGTEIHGAIEHYFLTGEVKPEYKECIRKVREVLFNEFGEQDWLAEKSMAHQDTDTKLWYGGKVDLQSSQVVLDYKTKDFTANKLPKPYSDNAMQLAAYRAETDRKCANLFIDRSDPTLVHLHVWEEGEIDLAMSKFQCALKYWYLENNL